MTSTNTSLALAGAFVAAIGLASQIPTAMTADDQGKDKCYSIAMAGKNDCTATGNNSCAGTAKGDYDKGAWKYVTKGTC